MRSKLYIVKNSHPGFTIMEMVVVMGIFAMVSTIVTAVFFSTTRWQKQAAAQQTMQSELRFAMESIVNEVRQGFIDYNSYTNLTNTTVQEELKLINYLNKKVSFKKENVLVDNQEVGILKISTNGGQDWSPLTSSQTNIVRAEFYISPSEDPFSQVAASPPNIQPRVTIIMSGIAKNAAGSGPIFLQTTVLTRSYKR